MLKIKTNQIIVLIVLQAKTTVEITAATIVQIVQEAVQKEIGDKKRRIEFILHDYEDDMLHSLF